MKSGIVKAIVKMINAGNSTAYIEAVAWGMRDSETSMSDIVFAVEILQKANESAMNLCEICS